MDSAIRVELKSQARRVLSEQRNAFVIAGAFTLIVLAILQGYPYVGGDIESASSSWFPVVFVSLIAIGVDGFLRRGLAGMALKALRGQLVAWTDVFDGKEKLSQTLGVTYLMTLKIYLWSLLFIVPGIIASFRYALVYFVIAENPDMSASEALAESGRLMKGHKWELFVLMLSFILWGLLSLVTFGIATIWIYPYQTVTYAAFYRKLKGSPIEEEIEIVQFGLIDDYEERPAEPEPAAPATEPAESAEPEPAAPAAEPAEPESAEPEQTTSES